ncbi:FadR/GntR family transcriptional regulator [Desertimonas flava]|uniref:FadR/GntR family transcriptional regulator n=1 Tax=Desertimonas flava TaxID=2064846 RepID=UPI0019698980|nr:GntR family transcriptional regulator [Desertimonas flava]
MTPSRRQTLRGNVAPEMSAPSTSTSSTTPPARGANLLVPVAADYLAQTVSRQLADAINLGLFAVGEQLPAESTLAGQLGVSTVTLRDALATLRRKGLVETRRGRNGGSFVVGPAAPPTDRLRDRLRELSVVELRDLGDEWTAVSGAAARFAAARASDDEVAHLRALADDLAAAGDVVQRVRANSRFGIELALASQSARLTRAEVRLQAESGELLWTSTESPLDPAEVAADLHRIADAVADEDALAARDLAEQRTRQNVRWLIGAHLELSDS